MKRRIYFRREQILSVRNNPVVSISTVAHRNTRPLMAFHAAAFKNDYV